MKLKLQWLGNLKVEHQGKEVIIKTYRTDKFDSSALYAMSTGKKIIFDKNFFEITDKEVKQFIINHEIGHILNGHTGLSITINNVMNRIFNKSNDSARDITLEYIADNYAISQGHNAIYVFENLYTSISADPAMVRSYAEIKLRYEHAGGSEELIPTWYKKMPIENLKVLLSTNFHYIEKLKDLQNCALGMPDDELLGVIEFIMNKVRIG